MIAAQEGRPPAGWLGPWISQSRVTPDLLAEAGYRYLLDWDHDDQPTWFTTRGGGRILTVPYPQELNDIPAIVARKETGRQFADALDGVRSKHQPRARHEVKQRGGVGGGACGSHVR